MAHPKSLIVVADDSLLSEQIRVTNEREFVTRYGTNRIMYQKRIYELPVGEERLIPRAAVNIWFGDPELADDPENRENRPRTDALKKLKAKWGISAVDTRASTFPKVTLRAFDGTEFTPITADPQGLGDKNLDLEVDPRALQMMLAKAEQQAEQLRQLAAQNNVDVGLDAVVSEPFTPEAFAATSDAPIPESTQTHSDPATNSDPAPAPNLSDLPDIADPSVDNSPRERKAATVTKKAPAKKAAPKAS